MRLSILIPTLKKREESFYKLYFNLTDQISILKLDNEIEILLMIDSGEKTIGEKRNLLLHRATGEYVCFFDDDDIPSKNYIEKIYEGIKSKADCLSLRGVITWDGERPEIFEHSIKYSEWKTNDTGDVKYERYPNHLNVIKSIIAKQFKFPEINHGEDIDWSMQMRDSGLLKNEYYINEVLYHYQFNSVK